MSEPKPFPRALVPLLLLALLDKAESGARDGGPKSFDQVLEDLAPKCSHAERADEIEKKLAHVQEHAVALDRRIQQVVHEIEIAPIDTPFTHRIKAILLGLHENPVKSPANEAAATCGGEAIETVHEETAMLERDRARLDGNNVRAGAGVQGTGPVELAPSHMAALHQAVDEIGGHTAAMVARLNDRLPRGFFAHITIAKKD